MKAISEENEQFSILSRLVLLPPGIGSASTCIAKPGKTKYYNTNSPAFQSNANHKETIQIHLYCKAIQSITIQNNPMLCKDHASLAVFAYIC